MRVLVAGVAGASLGTELIKCLMAAGGYRLSVCDVAPIAYGLHQDGIASAHVVDRKRYIADILKLCARERIQFILPGADEPAAILARERDAFRKAGVHLAGNEPAVVALCSDKSACFTRLAELGFPIPRTCAPRQLDQRGAMSYPCIVKPATGSGGSAFVFLAKNRDEARLYVEYLLRNGKSPMLQAYTPEDEGGEFTVGVLTLGDRTTSIAMRRVFYNKLSVLQRTASGLISTGYSQGLIDDFPEVRAVCEEIAAKIGSQGPINVQGRLYRGRFLPFEINPRFSASVWLRAMAGINEPDLYLRHALGLRPRPRRRLRTGYYLRSLTEYHLPAARS